MRPFSETVQTLRLASDHLRGVAARRSAGKRLPWEAPLADLLDEHAASAQRHFEAVQSPGTHVEDPGGVAQGDFARAERLIAGQHRNALRVARAILGEGDPPETVEIKGDML